MALREPGLPRLRVSHLAADLKLLVDARDQLVAEGTRIRNRLHALLLALAPGYRAETGALSSGAALRTARRLVRAGEASDPIRAWLALSAIRRLKAIDAEAAELEREIGELVEASGASRVRAICGVGPIVAAKILGETHAVDRFPTTPACHRYPPRAERPSAIASTAAATASSTGRCSRSPWSRHSGTARAARTWLGSAPKARPRPKPGAV